MKHPLPIGWFASLLLFGSVAFGQAIPAASRLGTLQLGVGALIVSPDYDQKDTKGLTFYGDLDFKKHIGIEGDIHLGSLSKPSNISEDSYLIGPRFSVRLNRLRPYAKVLFGIGRFQYYKPQYVPSSSTYGVYAIGGGLDIKATRSINIRAFDLEYQKWPGYGKGGLTPLAATIGVAYSFP